MEIITLSSVTVAAVLAAILWDRCKEIRKLKEDLKWQQDANMQLLKHEPVKDADCPAKEPEPLTVEKIADAVRMEGFFPEIKESWISFKVQGEGYFVDANRLPFVFLVKSYSVDPADWEMDLLKEAAHRMSDELVMVKATFSDDDKEMRFFVAACDRNYESFRANLSPYLSILEDGQRRMDEIYHQLMDVKRDEALKAQSVIPPVKQDSKVLS